jgi:shikimate dehydrogenase
MRTFGLVGYPLSHSFSRKFFSEKFEKEHITDATYENFEIPTITQFPDIVKSHPHLKGMNVTIPYKQEVMPYLDGLDKSAEFVGAVNVIKVMPDRSLIGFNSDYYGFMTSLNTFLPQDYSSFQALILGTGGAAKAIEGALKTLHIPYKYVSRNKKEGVLTYAELDALVMQQYRLIINASPAGMYPNVETCPDLDYNAITQGHYLYDIVYNPETTLFMEKGMANGAKAINGLEMLHLQALKAWEIWNA